MIRHRSHHGCQRGPDPKVLAANAEAGKAFLAKNAAEPGVKSLPSGLQYVVVRSGPETGVRPLPGDQIKVHYEGKLLSGQVFDSSYDRGVSLMKTRIRFRAPWRLAKSEPAPPVEAEPTWATTASGITTQAPPESRMR